MAQEEIKNNKEFEKAVFPLIKYMLQYENPHAIVIVDSVTAKLYEGSKDKTVVSWEG